MIYLPAFSIPTIGYTVAECTQTAKIVPFHFLQLKILYQITCTHFSRVMLSMHTIVSYVMVVDHFIAKLLDEIRFDQRSNKHLINFITKNQHFNCVKNDLKHVPNNLVEYSTFQENRNNVGNICRFTN